MDERPCDRLDCFLTGDLSVDRRAEFEQHLKDCQTCRDSIDEWHMLCATLTATGQLESPSRAMWERIKMLLSEGLDSEGELPRADREF